MATEPAWAKVNLCLHVTGQRADGYHTLDSLVVFAGVGDLVHAENSDRTGLTVTGPMAPALSELDANDNLVIRAARLIAANPKVALTLEKHLPPASGIGGGSADAAATLRLLTGFWGVPMPAACEILKLGADLPVCLAGQPCRMQGIGEVITPLGPIAPLWLVLVNPRVPVSTPQVFGALTNRDNPPLPWPAPDLSQPAGLLAYLARTRNDLQTPAMALAPVIGNCLRALEGSKRCHLARMSGSGATCFGLYPDETSAHAAATAIRSSQSDWWVAAAPILA